MRSPHTDRWETFDPGHLFPKKGMSWFFRTNSVVQTPISDDSLTMDLGKLSPPGTSICCEQYNKYRVTCLGKELFFFSWAKRPWPFYLFSVFLGGYFELCVFLLLLFAVKIVLYGASSDSRRGFPPSLEKTQKGERVYIYVYITLFACSFSPFGRR